MLLNFKNTSSLQQTFKKKLTNFIIIIILYNNKKRKNKSTRKKLEIEITRVIYLFKIIIKLKNNKNTYFIIRRIFIIDEIKTNIKTQHETLIQSIEIIIIKRNKYEHDSKNSLIKKRNIYNYISILRTKYLSNIIAIKILNIALQRDFD